MNIWVLLGVLVILFLIPLVFKINPKKQPVLFLIYSIIPLIIMWTLVFICYVSNGLSQSIHKKLSSNDDQNNS